MSGASAPPGLGAGPAGVEALLGPDGPLARALPGWEWRPAQQELALAVERTLSEGGVLLAEAGTGTGKTLAYLLPALLSGQKVVISTATRALQEQIVQHDLPLLEQVLGPLPPVAVMKGLGNYVCRRRFEEHRRAASAPALGAGAARRALAVLGEVERWVAATDSGDIAELDAVAEDDPIWAAVTSGSDTRLGARCRHHEECFVTRMRREAERARIVVVNHHLFFADRVLRGPHPGRVLPDYDAVVFDEAHQLEDVATLFLGVRVSLARLLRLASDAERALDLCAAALGTDRVRGAEAARAAVEAGARHWFAAVQAAVPGDEPRRTVEHDVWAGAPGLAWHALDDALGLLGSVVASALDRLEREGGGRRGAAQDAVEVVGRRAEELREQLSRITEGAAGRVTWIETPTGAPGGAGSPVLSSTPVDLAPWLRAQVFDPLPGVVLTSATLAVPGRTTRPFQFLEERLGLSEPGLSVQALCLDSPFDYRARALLYLPKDLPSPGEAAFLPAAADRAAALIEATPGGAFVLTTSLRSLRGLRPLLAARVGRRPLLVQGDAPKGALLDRFRAEGDAVLLATASFWEGVDVPGRALRLVVLEKIPFAVPSDPLVRARSLALEERGKNAFNELSLPLAALALKQGFGRLIRTATDAGVVALFDERVHRKGYGQRLLGALPPARRVTDVAEVVRFWDRIGAEAAQAGATPPAPIGAGAAGPAGPAPPRQGEAGPDPG